jgi:F-box domain
MANTLICLPPEIVHNILKYVNPIDLARVSKTCRILHRSIAQDRLLCKELYCRLLVGLSLVVESFACAYHAV